MQRKQIPNHFVKSLAKMFAVGLRHEVFHADSMLCMCEPSEVSIARYGI